MPIPSSVAGLPPDKLNTLLTVAKPKFDAYAMITSNVSRSIPQSNGLYLYPNEPMISDMVYLWAVFSNVYEILGKTGELATIVRREQVLKGDIRRIVEGDSSTDPDGSFWHSPAGSYSLQEVPLDRAVDAELNQVFRTLRNGFAHSNWLYDDLTALEYWKKRGWQTADAAAGFRLENRPAKNYMTYIADAKKFDPQRFWGLEDLRILVTHSGVLRHHLHTFLNYLLNGSRKDVFGN